VDLPRNVDLTAPELQDDPYPVYEQLRQRCPVGFSEEQGGVWLLTTYDDVYAAYRNAAVFSSAQIRVPYVDDPFGKEIPLQLDAPEHGKWRKILDPLFSASRMALQSDLIREQAHSLMKDATRHETCEFVREFTVPFPSRIFCILLGLPPEELDQYLIWATTLADVTSSQLERARAFEDFKTAKSAVRDRVTQAIDDRRRGHLGDDVISKLLQSEIDARPVTDEEIRNLCGLLFMAGLDTVTQAIGSMVGYLAQHPQEREALVNDPTLIPRAVEEFLRWDSQVSPGRVVTEELEMNGQTLLPGDRALLITGSADRDESQFDHPEIVDFARTSNRHLAFGMGPHRCAGSHLARLELRIALEEIHGAMPVYSIAPGERIERHTGQLRGTHRLPLKIG
jgi:cytochrome P450